MRVADLDTDGLMALDRLVLDLLAKHHDDLDRIADGLTVLGEVLHAGHRTARWGDHCDKPACRAVNDLAVELRLLGGRLSAMSWDDDLASLIGAADSGDIRRAAAMAGMELGESEAGRLPALCPRCRIGFRCEPCRRRLQHERWAAARAPEERRRLEEHNARYADDPAPDQGGGQ